VNAIPQIRSRRLFAGITVATTLLVLGGLAAAPASACRISGDVAVDPPGTRVTYCRD
jgi:hypothetical protein